MNSKQLFVNLPGIDNCLQPTFDMQNKKTVIMKRSLLSNLSIATLYITGIFATKAAQAQTISTFAGNGTATHAGDGGAATAASIRYPYHTAFDASGNMLIADWGNNRIRKITPAGVITTIAGTGVPAFGGDGGAATAAYLNQPADIAIDGSGNIYFSDNGNKRIRKIDASGIISTEVGTGSPGYSGDGGPAVSAQINDPRGIMFDASGNLYIAEASNHVIRKINTAGVISTIAGNHTAGFSGDGGAATAAQLNTPQDIAVDAAGNMYISDNLNHRIRKISTAGIISTYVGTGSSGFSGDGGAATLARLNYPYGLQIDAYDNMYIADGGNNRIRKVKPTGIISTVAGNGSFGFGGDGGPATAAILNTPNSTSKDASGNLYISDELNARIRKVTPTPITLSGGGAICVGATLGLTASEPGGTWSSASTSIATVGTSGVVTGVAAGTVVISYTESGITGVKTITINPLPAPIAGTLTVCVGSVTTLTNSDPGGIWASGGTSIATVDASGNVTGIGAGTASITYTLPSGCNSTATVTVDPCPYLSANTISGPMQKLKLYPNPNNGSFTIDLPEQTTALIISDFMGRIFLTQNLENTTAETRSFNFDSLPAGNYILKTVTKELGYVNKIQINK